MIPAGGIKISRPKTPGTNRINLSGFYDYDMKRDVVVFTNWDGNVAEFKVETILEFLAKQKEKKK